MEEKLFNAFEGKKLKWIEETYPEIIKQYDAIRELEKAEESARADQHKFLEKSNEHRHSKRIKNYP